MKRKVWSDLVLLIGVLSLIILLAFLLAISGVVFRPFF